MNMKTTKELHKEDEVSLTAITENYYRNVENL